MFWTYAVCTTCALKTGALWQVLLLSLWQRLNVDDVSELRCAHVLFRVFVSCFCTGFVCSVFLIRVSTAKAREAAQNTTLGRVLDLRIYIYIYIYIIHAYIHTLTLRARAGTGPVGRGAQGK